MKMRVIGWPPESLVGLPLVSIAQNDHKKFTAIDEYFVLSARPIIGLAAPLFILTSVVSLALATRAVSFVPSLEAQKIGL
jgi:hypothetical protein